MLSCKTEERSVISYLLHNCILVFLSPLVALYILQRYFSGKSRPGWSERWGHLAEALRRSPDGRPRIWIHAVSAGEVVAAVPILRALRERLPHSELFLSVITEGGHEMASQQAAKFIDALFYFPFDLPWVVRRVVNQLRPDLFVSLESELWPNTLHELKRQGVGTVMVNGRISDKNFRRASGLGQGLFRWMLSNMDRCLMQSEADAQRIRSLSRAEEPERVAVLGNSKFDQEIKRLTPEQTLALRRDLRLPETAPVFVAGSTRSKEEEAQVIQAYVKMRERFPDLCLLIAPRHIDRAEEIAEAMLAAGLTPSRRSRQKEADVPVLQMATGAPSADSATRDLLLASRLSADAPIVRHLILDTLGELANVYAVATFAFVGNSFEPVVKGGGQNLLQPLAHGKPVLFGPRTATIRSEVALSTGAGVGFQVADGDALAEVGIGLLEDERLRGRIQEKALSLIEANRGVSARYAEAIAEMISNPPPPRGQTITEAA